MIWLIRGVFGCRKNFVKKRTKIYFSIFIENRNWDLKFVFQFDNENEKRKTLKFLFHFKTKIEYPFRSTDLRHLEKVPCNENNYWFKIEFAATLQLRKHWKLSQSFEFCNFWFLSLLSWIKNCDFQYSWIFDFWTC